MALTLQLQRVPDDWEAASARPCLHTLKTWINCKSNIQLYLKLFSITKIIFKAQVTRYNHLCGWMHRGFKNITTINFSVMKNHEVLLNAILQQKCARNKWSTDEVCIF